MGMKAHSLCVCFLPQTANSTSFTLHEVAKRPDLQDKLYHEIITVLGERKYPTFDDLQKLTLVRNTVKETLRCVCVGGGGGALFAPL